ncbi:MAG: LuxR family transcriptional regulator [Acidimicrobiales bacterium]|nr:LuxR family transcriptional regulator [Acidimicrobiales bacterium]
MSDWPFIGRADELRRLDACFASADVGGVVVVGEIGGGKSWLARRWLEGAAATRGHQVVQCGGGIADIPLGCLSPLAGAGHTAHAAPVTGAHVEARLRAAGRDQDLVLLVEDAQWIDPESALVVRRLMVDEVLRPLITVRADSVLAPPLADLVDDAMHRIELAPLTSIEIAQLLGAALDGPVDPALVQTVTTVSRGNPLFVRELLTASLATGAVHLDQWWTLARPLEVSLLLTDLVATRIDLLSAAARHAFDLVAEAGAMDREHLGAVTTAEVLTELETAGYLEPQQHAGRAGCRPAHALFAEVALARLPMIERRVLRGALAQSLEALQRPGDDALLATLGWRLGSLKPPATSELHRGLEAAMAARDYALAVACGRLLWQREPSVEAALRLGDALYAQHTPAGLRELDDVLAQAHEALAPTDERRVEVATLRALNLGVGLGRLDESVELLAEATASGDAAPGSDRQAVALGATLLYSGLPGPALDALAGVDLTQQPVAEMYRLTALWTAGRLREVHDHVRRRAPDGPRWLLSSEASALVFEGDLDGSTRAAHAYLAAPATETAEDGVYGPVALVALGMVSMARGQSAAAIGHFQEAARRGSFGITVVPLGMMARAAAHRGDLPLARSSLEAMDEILSPGGGAVPLGQEGLNSLTLYASAPARAAVARADGHRLRDVTATLRRAAARARQLGQGLPEAMLLNEVVCLRAARAGDDDRLAELQVPFGGELAPLWAAHAVAAVAKDAAGLCAVAERALELGIVHDAVHAAWSAWLVAVEAGRPTSAASARALLDDLVARTDWQPTFRPAPARLATLSERELQVSHLAAAGWSSREVAEHLGLSPRTVTNNIQRIYLKLGVTNRQQLRDLVALP